MTRPDPHPGPPPHVLREYALIADGERGALVGPQGDIAWLCAPRWDSGAVFASLIGGAGHYTLTPRARFVWGGFYEPGTLIWRNRWVTADGVIECREALAFPGDPGRAVLLRRVRAVEGDARVTVALEPYAEYGARPPRDVRHERPGVWTGRSGPLHWRWTGAADARPGGDGRRTTGLTAELTVPAGGHHDLVLELSADRPGREPVDADRAWHATQDAWARAAQPLPDCLAPDDTRHAHTVLRGLTSASGGMVAAATTSLPERAEAGRNYDYRYVWMRDQCYAGQAAAAAGAHRLTDDAVRFVAARLHEDGPRLSPAYTVTGGPVPDQETLPLPGYPGGGDRIGNHVNRQFQLDAFGEALLLFAAAARAGRLGPDGRRAADIAVAAIEARHHEPDAGIWELDARTWTHSRLICAAGLRAMAASVPCPQAASWAGLADTLTARTAATSTHPTGRWQCAPDDPGLDAALLLPAVRGGIGARDPRTVRTLDAYRAELTHDHYAYRFRHDERPLAEAEGAFLFCGHLMALAEHQQGNEREAVRWFERNRAACGPPGLFTEEYDIGQRQLRGNLPQAFVHALMLETSVRLAAPAPSEGEET
ncbi:glycoside hydrolase family 15 protein [Streptomyces sp. OfavH-34-F]|uniref:glycoside hydrolase family 15 protein n=1 Tax=Streptomyces sp. OfavH-34-F TaxID=2917760 RepID=UPI001EF18E7C|nr:glycoside hydrolase family 15 protein [Streptomyces sp. OfavH-34-F]MCG7525317.1 glycoside hydrolase family 15 protein [Streptomyces sp. OfavH-34-F]